MDESRRALRGMIRGSSGIKGSKQWKNQRAGKLDCKLDLSIVRLTEIRIRG